MKRDIIPHSETNLENAESTLEILLKMSTAFIEKSKSTSTRKSYQSDWSHFVDWCTRYELPYMPTTNETYALYLSSMVLDGLKASTIQRRMSSIAQAHYAKNFDTPSTKLIKEVWSGIKKEIGTYQEGKQPILIETLFEMLKLAPANIKGSRDKALLLIGFVGAFRRSELVNLDVSDFRLSKQGYTVRIKYSKTDQDGKGEFVAIPYGQSQETCPVLAIQNWLTVSSIESGPVFRAINKIGHLSEKRLSDKSVALIVKRYVEAVGLDPAMYAGHSLRKGFATTAAMRGSSERSIKEQTRHKSDAMLRRYIVNASLFMENAANDLGL
ncbi:MAG: site-specific integrase [Candidatus Pristimantibacillus sp.]